MSVLTPCPPPAEAPPPPPPCLDSAPILVVGGGPVGHMAAIQLAQRGLSVTLVERAALDPFSDPARAYSLSLNKRSFRVMRTCPGLLDRVSDAAVTSSAVHMLGLKAAPGAALAELKFESEDTIKHPFRFLLRSTAVRVLAEYLAEQPGVTTHYETTVKGARFNDDGSTTVSLSGPSGTPEEVTARLVLACDGKQSPIVAALRAAHGAANVSSRAGFDDRAWEIPSSNKFLKTLVFKPEMRDAIARAGSLPGGKMPPGAGYALVPAPGRPAKRSCTFASFPVHEADNKALGGIIGTCGQDVDNEILHATDVDEAYDILQENYPLLNMREMVELKHMQQFVKAGPGWPVGKVRRTKSIVAHIGGSGDEQSSSGNGGVILLGEAAHSFPPDIGQGFNAGVEDTGVLAHLIDTAGKSATIGDIVRAFERERDDDVEGMVYVHRYGARWQFGMPLDLGGAIWLAGFLGRMALSSVVPGLHPPLMMLAGGDDRFGTCMRKAKATTRRIWAGLLVAVGAVVMASRRE